MDDEQRRAAKARLVEGMLQGQSWQDAVIASGLDLWRSGAYRLTQRVCVYGEAALQDGRHGHVAKMHAPVQHWLDAYCRGAPGTPSRIVQAALHERFGLRVSITHLNRVRAARGIGSRAAGGERNRASSSPGDERSRAPSPPGEAPWQEGAGGLLLLAGASQTALLPILEQGLPPRSALGPTRVAQATPVTRRMLLLTLLFLGAVGLRRTWDLRGYVGDGLGVLTGRRRAYGYRAAERFLAEVATLGGAETLTDALATWTTGLWHPGTAAEGAACPSLYIDGHRKAVYTDALVPRGLVARRGTVLGCRALVLLHDAAGHPLLITTHRGDLHLTVGAPALLARYEQHHPAVRRLVIDREGMATEFLRQLTEEGRQVITVLRADQYAGLSSFTAVGPFVPLRYDRQGTLVREVAPARCTLAVPQHPGEHVDLCVALVRDLRRQVPCALPAEADQPWWTDDLQGADRCWWEPGWVATPLPALATEAKLIPIVTTAASMEPTALAETYFHRWPAQENAIRDFLIPLGIDTNHGYAKTVVLNSEVAKRRAALEQRLVNVRRWAAGARERARKASALYHRLEHQTKERSEELYHGLIQRRFALEEQGLDPHAAKWRTRDDKAAIDGEVEGRWQRVRAAFAKSTTEEHKHHQYCREQRELLRALEDLAARERAMYELDNAKDQVMTVCKGALANLAMWVRDHYFPAGYAHATWARLAPFFRLPGRIVWGPQVVHVELRPFNDRRMTRDLLLLCERVRSIQPRLPDGRRLVFSVLGVACPLLHEQSDNVA